MAKILLSWLAFNNDFKKKEDNSGFEVEKSGTTFSFHQYFFEDYEKHILLSGSKGDDTKTEHLINQLKLAFPNRVIEPEYMRIENNDVIDLEKISSKVQTLLYRLRDYEIDIFISPGTPTMQTAWVLAHLTLNLNTRLIQVRPKKYTKDKKRPERLFVNIKRDRGLASLIIKETKEEKASVLDLDRNFLKTKSITPLYDKAYKVAQSYEATVLIQGETGTGKEYLAKFIHENSFRRNAPFVAVNCSAMSDQLLESRLFGYVKGAFTGADNDTPGILQRINEGTVFLDEIGDISPYMQQVLLRTIQEKEITPIGGKMEKIDVRFIAATNRDLIQMCEEGKFRWDLYYRLAVVELEIPTLKERGKKELKEMIKFFIRQKKQQFKAKKIITIPKEVMSKLLEYPFPGNIRELENLIENFYVLNSDGKVGISNLPKRILHPKEKYTLLLRDIEKQHIRKVLRLHNFNMSKTAKAIGIVYNTLTKKIKDYGIEIEKEI